MDWKSTFKEIAIKKAADKILPMDEVKPKRGKKAKVAGILGVIAAIATAGAQYLGS